MKGFKIAISLVLVLLVAMTLCACVTQEKISYTVTFDTNGGGESSSSVLEGETVGEPTAPFKEGYDFLGWYLSDSIFDFSSPITSNVTLVAKWVESVDLSAFAGKWAGREGEGNEYRLNIYDNGAVEFFYYEKEVKKALSVVRVTSEKGRYINLEYTLDGESKNILFEVSDTLKGIGLSGGELSLSKLSSHQITYHLANGKTQSVSYTAGDKVVHPQSDLDKNLALDGWYTEDGKLFKTGNVVESDLDLFQSVYTQGLEIEEGIVVKYEGVASIVQIPTFYQGERVCEIGENAFAFTTIEEVVFTESIVKIGKNAFYGCSSLKEIQFESVEEIGDYAFFDCNALVSIVVPSSVKAIGKGAFGTTLVYGIADTFTMFNASGSALSTITLPFVGGGAEDNSFFAYIFGAESYDQNNFYNDGIEMTVNGDTRLVNFVNYIPISLSTVYISNSENIPDYAFYNCFYLKNVNYTQGIKKVGISAFESCYDVKVKGLQSVEEIGARAFLGSGFAGEDMENLTSIGDYAFADSNLNSLTLFEGLKYIGDSAFAYTAIDEITIPQSVEEIGDTLFFGCNYLTDVTFLAPEPCDIGTTLFTTIEGDYIYYSTVKIWVPEGESFTLYRKQVNMRDYASCIYPIGLKGESGYIVVDGSLYGYIGEALETVEIPEGVVEIADFAFYNCITITDIVMPEGFKRIGKYAFYNCTSVQNLHMSSTFEEIGDYAFTGFFVGNNISRLYFPEGFKRIGDGAFLSSFNLKIVELPSTLEYIGYLAFGMANSLERMYLASQTPPEIGTYQDDVGGTYTEIFSIINAGKTIIYVPSGRVDGVSVLDIYRSTEGFSQFADYVKARPDGAEVGHYGDGNLFINLDGCDSVVLSVLAEAEEDTSDFGGSKYEFVKLQGTYTLLGAVLQMDLPEYGKVNAIYADRTITLALDGVSYKLVEPKYYYDSYNWTNFRLYPTTDTEGKGLFDMYGSFLTPFDWKIEEDKFLLSIDGNNKLPENSAYAGVVEYTGAYDKTKDSFTVSFMLNDYAEIMNFKCNRNKVVYASGEVTRLYGTYKAYAENNPDYAMFTLVSMGNGVVDIYIGDSLYEGCTYTMTDGVITIDFQTLTLTFTMNKDGYLEGDFFGTDCCFVYVDELLDSTKLPSRDDVQE